MPSARRWPAVEEVGMAIVLGLSREEAAARTCPPARRSRRTGPTRRAERQRERRRRTEFLQRSKKVIYSAGKFFKGFVSADEIVFVVKQFILTIRFKSKFVPNYMNYSRFWFLLNNL